LPQIFELDLIQSRLEKDRSWTAYALADLEPGYVEHTSWFCAGDGSGLVLLYREYPKPIVFCIEPSKFLASVLHEIVSVLYHDGSRRVVNSQTPEIVAGLEDASLVRRLFAIIKERRMIRMVLNAARFCPAGDGSAVRLGPDKLDSVRALYREEPPEFFFNHMLERGIYFGIFEGADLVAIAGTHIVSPCHGVAAIGNVYTRADRRERGYARITASAVTRALRVSGISTTVLNVRKDNQAALNVYRRLGFEEHCEYFEMDIQPNKEF